MNVASKKKYPQAAPFRAPEELAAQCERWRRRTYGLVAVVVAIAAIGVASVTVAINNARAAKNSPPASPEEIVVALEPAARPAAEIAPPKPKVTPIVHIMPPTLPKKVIEPAQSAKSDPRRDRFLEALGSLSAAYLFQSYLNIGLLADGVESEAYTTKEAEDTLLSINEVMNQVDAQLVALSRSGLEAEDLAAIEQIKTAAAMLRLQSTCLQNYWRTGEKAKADEYHEARQGAWKGLTKIMQGDSK